MQCYDNAKRTSTDLRASLARGSINYWLEWRVSRGDLPLGYVIERSGREFEARSLGHRPIGTFATLDEAMRACGPAP
jgi:hypothetical protein